MIQLSQAPTLFSLLAIILSSTHTSSASPYPRELDADLTRRYCTNPCGWQGQLCCASSQYCYTDSLGQAQCGNSGAAGQSNGGWQYYTSTFVRTGVETVTTTFSTYFPGITPSPVVSSFDAVVTAICNLQLNEQSCGPICCAQGQFCFQSGSCLPNNDQSSNNFGPTVPATTSASAYIRPTSNTVIIVTATGTATTTVPFQAPIATDGASISPTAVSSNAGLSPGAIAGIVFGVLAALIILFLICICCCAKGILDSILAIFGLGKKKRTTVQETEIYESRHSHHSGRASSRPPQRRWFGVGPARADRPAEKQSSGLGGMLGVAGLLAGLAVILGLKRKNDRDAEKSNYGSRTDDSYSSYYTETSASSASSDDRRTRGSGRTRDDRNSRR